MCDQIFFNSEKKLRSTVKPVSPWNHLHLIYTKESFAELVNPPETNYERKT